MADEQLSQESSPLASSVSRRKLLAGAGAAIGMAAIGAVAYQSTDAQNAPIKEEQSGTGPATPNALSASPVPDEITQYASDWPVAYGNLQATRAALNSSINSGNLAQLTQVWSVPITAQGNFSGMTGTPIVLGDTIYMQDMESNVYAVKRDTGELIWRTDYSDPSNGPNGVAVAYGMVFAATGDTSTAFALDAATGKQIWAVKLTNNNYECIDMAPAVYDNFVYVSTNPNNTAYGNYRGGARGILYALDAATGATMWSFDTSVDNLWNAPRINSGAGLWYPPSFDEDGNMYFGTGNPGPYPGNAEYPNGTSRPAPNDYSDSMVSLSLATGGVNWSVNAAPLDLFDHDFQLTPVLATVTLNDTPTLLAIGAGKTGTVVAAGAKTGALHWKTKVGMHENDQLEELPPGTTRVYPGGLGGVLTPLAFAEGLVFAPYIDSPMYVTPTESGDAPDDRPPSTGGIAALDATTGDIVWDNKVAAFVAAGATVVNDVVLSGSLDGYLRAYDIKTGDQVWEWQGPAGLNAPPAVAGDMIIIPACGPYIAAAFEGGTPVPTGQAAPAVVALKLGS